MRYKDVFYYWGVFIESCIINCNLVMVDILLMWLRLRMGDELWLVLDWLCLYNVIDV